MLNRNLSSDELAQIINPNTNSGSAEFMHNVMTTTYNENYNKICEYLKLYAPALFPEEIQKLYAPALFPKEIIISPTHTGTAKNYLNKVACWDDLLQNEVVQSFENDLLCANFGIQSYIIPEQQREHIALHFRDSDTPDLMIAAQEAAISYKPRHTIAYEENMYQFISDALQNATKWCIHKGNGNLLVYSDKAIVVLKKSDQTPGGSSYNPDTTGDTAFVVVTAYPNVPPTASPSAPTDGLASLSLHTPY